MIKAYLDESGIHDGASVCVVAGYFGGLGQWKRFERLWKQVLLKFDIPEFHAKGFVKNTRHTDLILALAKATVRYKIYPVSHAIFVKDFHNFSKEERRFLTGATLSPLGQLAQGGSPDRPYFAPFQQIIKRVATYAPKSGKAHFSFGLSGLQKADQHDDTIFGSFGERRDTSAD
jgi:hypothetical protein